MFLDEKVLLGRRADNGHLACVSGIVDPGEQVDYLDLVFRYEWVSGDPHPAVGELTEVSWRRLGELGDATPDDVRNIALSLAEDDPARFDAGIPRYYYSRVYSPVPGVFTDVGNAIELILGGERQYCCSGCAGVGGGVG